MTGHHDGVSVVVCTRDRPAQLHRTLDALQRQTLRDFEIVVVDQSERPDAALAQRAGDVPPALRVVRSHELGLSRGWNAGWREARGAWIVRMDDDCIPAPDWMERFAVARAEQPDAALVSGAVLAGDRPVPPGQAATLLAVDAPELLRGARVRPWRAGVGPCFAIRRSALERLGGLDERLGPGRPAFPSSEDMDLNYRLLRSGESAYVTPALRVVHDQWRAPADLPHLLRGYMTGWTGFALKHARTGDVRGGLWLWRWGVADVTRTLAGAVRRRSFTGVRIASAKAQGLAIGTARGLRERW